MESILSDYIIVSIVAVIAFVISYYMIPVIINVSNLKGLFDEPDHRKLHTTATPNLGGIALFAALLISYAVSGFATAVWAPYLLAGLTILFFSGLKDDILAISPAKKLILQCVAILILMWGSGISITNFGGIFGINKASYGVSMMATFCTMVVVVNSYNLIDGIDGLAGGVGIIASLFFGAWFYATAMMPQAVLAFATAGALVGFLFYNFQPARIFMGDTGSQVIGYLLGFLAVSFVKTGVESTVAVPFKNEVPVLVIAVLIVPLYDTLRVFIVRMLKRHSPFMADRRHVHHQLIDCGFSHRSSCFIIYGFNLFIVGLVIAFSSTDVNILFSMVLLSAIILFPTARYKRNLLEKMGFNMPSADRIKTLEKKIRLVPYSRDDWQADELKKTEERNAKEVAV